MTIVSKITRPAEARIQSLTEDNVHNTPPLCWSVVTYQHGHSDLLEVWFGRRTDRVELEVIDPVQWLQLLELLQVELGHLIVDHVTDGKVAGEHLEEHEGRLDAVDGPLQRQDHGRLVEEQEEDERSLEEHCEHPEASELRHLKHRDDTIIFIFCNIINYYFVLISTILIYISYQLF